MKLVMTLLVRDEADILDANLAFHLNAGVDLVVATDHRSQDGTTEILESYADDGYVHLIKEAGDEFRQPEFVTRMAHTAATELGADWILHADADEFWWPRGSSLKQVLEAVPMRYGIVRGLMRHFVPRPDDGSFFAERMDVSLAGTAPINDPSSRFRPTVKVGHRGDPAIRIGLGNHSATSERLVPMRGWCPLEVLHFPIRTTAQCEQKYLNTHTAWPTDGREPGTFVQAAFQAIESGHLEDYYGSLAVDAGARSRGLADGTLQLDIRVRDVLRALRSADRDGFRRPHEGPRAELAPPDLLDEVAFAADIAVLAEADEVRLLRRLDELERRQRAVETLVSVRLERWLRRALRF
jgi:hypothetical protein